MEQNEYPEKIYFTAIGFDTAKGLYGECTTNKPLNSTNTCAYVRSDLIPRWISVEECLPPDDVEVIVLCGRKFLTIKNAIHTSCGSWYDNSWNGLDDLDVIRAWMYKESLINLDKEE